MKDKFLEIAIAEAKKGLTEGGIPIGSVIVHKGKILGKGVCLGAPEGCETL